MSFVNKKTILWLSGILILTFLTVFFADDEFITSIRQLNFENLIILILLQLTTLILTGLGTFESTFGILFRINGYLFSQGLTLAILSRLVTYWLPFILSFLATIYLVLVDDMEIFSMKSKKRERVSSNKYI